MSKSLPAKMARASRNFLKIVNDQLSSCDNAFLRVLADVSGKHVCSRSEFRNKPRSLFEKIDDRDCLEQLNVQHVAAVRLASFKRFCRQGPTVAIG